MKSKHTAAPWIALKGTDGEPDRWTVCADGERHFLIATIKNGQPGDFLDTEEATAHLVSAAPDLLEALERALSWLTSYPGGGAVACYDQARAAIAKAKGETP